jgi:hypothetical protein
MHGERGHCGRRWWRLARQAGRDGMTESEELKPGEVAVLPVDVERGLALVLGTDIIEGESWPMPKGLIADALTVGGLMGGAGASKALLDGSLVRLAPQTLARIRQGAVFARDKQDVPYGTLREGNLFSDAVRFVDGPANAVAGQLMLQTMTVQMQLRQIQETLEDINEKLDTLLKSEQHGVLAEVIATCRAVEELNDKVSAGHRLSDADEVKLRDYQDVVRTHLAEAELWLQQLNGLLQLEDPSLRAQYEALDGALRREPVAFWLRVYIVSHVSLGEIRKLLLARAAAAEPEYARDLHDALQQQLRDSAAAVQSLCHDMDRYLRRSDIAAGLEELSILRKVKVRRLRRQLWEVDEQLKLSLEATRGMYEAVPSLEPIEVPDPLNRRAVEPWVVRDNVYDAAVKATDVGTDALATAADRGSRALRELADKRRAAREDASSATTDDE